MHTQHHTTHVHPIAMIGGWWVDGWAASNLTTIGGQIALFCTHTRTRARTHTLTHRLTYAQKLAILAYCFCSATLLVINKVHRYIRRNTHACTCFSPQLCRWSLRYTHMHARTHAWRTHTHTSTPGGGDVGPVIVLRAYFAVCCLGHCGTGLQCHGDCE